jgi:hypothetical protein
LFFQDFFFIGIHIMIFVDMEKARDFISRNFFSGILNTFHGF